MRDFLLKRETNVKIFGVDRVESDISDFKFNLSNFSETLSLIDEIKPDQIYHLAGTFTNDFETDFDSNVKTTKNILDAIIQCNLNTKVLIVGSAAEYGNVSSDRCPIVESTPLRPTSFYGLTKVLQHNLMLFYKQNFDTDVVMARTFNIRSRNLSPRLFLGSLYEQIDKIKEGKKKFIETGSLSFRRDYLTINEIVEHYQTIMNKGLSGEVYNVGSGKSECMRTLLFEILDEEQIDHHLLKEDSKSYSSTSSVSDIYADASKLRQLYQS